MSQRSYSLQLCIDYISHLISVIGFFPQNMNKNVWIVSIKFSHSIWKIENKNWISFPKILLLRKRVHEEKNLSLHNERSHSTIALSHAEAFITAFVDIRFHIQRFTLGVCWLCHKDICFYFDCGSAFYIKWIGYTSIWIMYLTKINPTHIRMLTWIAYISSECNPLSIQSIVRINTNFCRDLCCTFSLGLRLIKARWPGF